jgi:hypothetical protein
MSFDPGFSPSFHVFTPSTPTPTTVDVLLTSADLTRSTDSDWETGSIWFDPDAEAGGLPTATVVGPATIGGTWSESPSFPHIIVVAPPLTGGLVLVSAIGVVSAASTLKLRIGSDCPDWLPVEVAVGQPQAIHLAGNGRLEPGAFCDFWVESQGSGTITVGGSLVPVFLPAGVRSVVQGDPWGRYWDGSAWQPPVLAGASITLGNSHIWDGGDPATTPSTRTLDGGSPPITPTTRTIDGGTP